MVLNFASLPMSPVGTLGFCLGDYCRFHVTHDEGMWDEHGVPEGKPCACVFPPGTSTPRVLHEQAALLDEAALRRFVECERKVWSPCAELDPREPALMSDMFFSSEIKLFVYAAHAARPASLVARLDRWAELVRPHVRIFLAEPTLCEAVLADAGLGAADTPTAVAEDSTGGHNGGQRTKWRLSDMQRGGAAKAAAPGLDAELLRSFLEVVARKAGLGAEAARLLREA